MSSKGTILLTGYEAFGDFKVNPSIAACMELDGRDIEGYRVAVEEITMKFNGVKEAIEGHLERYKPVAVVCTGVSGAGLGWVDDLGATRCTRRSGARGGFAFADACAPPAM